MFDFSVTLIPPASWKDQNTTRNIY